MIIDITYTIHYSIFGMTIKTKKLFKYKNLFIRTICLLHLKTKVLWSKFPCKPASSSKTHPAILLIMLSIFEASCRVKWPIA